MSRAHIKLFPFHSPPTWSPSDFQSHPHHQPPIVPPIHSLGPFQGSCLFPFPLTFPPFLVFSKTSRDKCRFKQWLLFFTLMTDYLIFNIRSDQISRSVVSDSLWPHESHNARPPCPSPTPGVPLDSCPSSQWCHIGLYNLLLTLDLYRGFPGGASGKEPACQCWRHKWQGFDPWVQKSLWRRTWQPSPVFTGASLVVQLQYKGAQFHP